MLEKRKLCKQMPPHTHNKREKCSICKAIDQKMQLFQIVDRSLIKKYSKLVSDSTNTSELNQFLFGLSVHYPGGITQFQKQYCIIKQYLSSYYPIVKTKLYVTQLIKKTARQFKNPYMHFYGPIYKILKKDREIKNNKIKLKDKYNHPVKVDIINNSFIKFRDQRRTSNFKKKDKMIKNLNQSFNQMKSLCKKIGIMCNKFNSQATNKKFKQHLQSLVNKRKDQMRSQKQLRANFDQNISIIKKQPSKSKQKSNKKSSFSRQVDDIYGISSKRYRKGQISQLKEQDERNKPYTNKRASTQQGQIIHNSPSSKAYYSRQCNYTQNAGFIKGKRKKISFFSISCQKLRKISESRSKKKRIQEQKQQSGRKSSDKKKKGK